MKYTKSTTIPTTHPCLYFSPILGHAMSASMSEPPRREYLFALPEPLCGLMLANLCDTRDLPMAHLVGNICLVTVPSALIIILTDSHVLGLLHLVANTVLFLEPLLLALHYGTHRPVFRSPLLNALLLAILPILFGIPPGLYRAHHVRMHHAEENAHPGDLSSTEPFQRDSVLHFALYWARFAGALWVELPAYVVRTRGYRAGAACAARILAAVVVVSAAHSVARSATIWCVLMPALVSSLALAFGNWSQHIFVRSHHQGSPFDITYSITESESNLRNFNDGFHAEHHHRPRLHWSELPAEFTRLCEQGVQERIVFRNTSFFEVGLCVMRGDYDTLTQKFVPMPGQGQSRVEVEALLRSRLAPVRRAKAGKEL